MIFNSTACLTWLNNKGKLALLFVVECLQWYLGFSFAQNSLWAGWSNMLQGSPSRTKYSVINESHLSCILSLTSYLRKRSQGVLGKGFKPDTGELQPATGAATVRAFLDGVPGTINVFHIKCQAGNLLFTMIKISL